MPLKIKDTIQNFPLGNLVQRQKKNFLTEIHVSSTENSVGVKDSDEDAKKDEGDPFLGLRNAPLLPNQAAKWQQDDDFADKHQRHRLRRLQRVANTHDGHVTQIHQRVQ